MIESRLVARKYIITKSMVTENLKQQKVTNCKKQPNRTENNDRK